MTVYNDMDADITEDELDDLIEEIEKDPFGLIGEAAIAIIGQTGIKTLGELLKPTKKFTKAKLKVGTTVPEIDDSQTAALAKEVTAYIEANPKRFMLGEPQTLTIVRKGGGFSKRPHIGGEEFNIFSTYAGKKGTLIFTFTPADAADYTSMEMSEREATASFTGFKEYIKKAASGEFAVAAAEAKKAAAAEIEHQKNAAKREQYSDIGMGSW